MNVLILGGTGFIGAPLVRRLVEKNHAVAVLHRGKTAADLPAGVVSLHGDRNALEENEAAVERFAPDVVVDVIPYTERQAEAAVRFFEGRAGRLVVLSSGDVYRNYDGLRRASDHAPDPVPLAEGAPLRETPFPYRCAETDFAYAEEYDKLLVERAVRDQPGLPATALRLPAVYGPGDRQHRFSSWLRRMDDGRPAILLGEEEAAWRWTHGYVENVAAAIACAVSDERAAGKTYNVGPAETPTQAEQVRRLGEAVGWHGKVVALSAERLPDTLKTGFDFDIGGSNPRLSDEQL